MTRRHDDLLALYATDRDIITLDVHAGDGVRLLEVIAPDGTRNLLAYDPAHDDGAAGCGCADCAPHEQRAPYRHPCGAPCKDGTPCRVRTPLGQRCRLHIEAARDAVA